MADRFDQHAVRHRMKLLRDTGETTLYENRDGVACPACGDPFDRLLLSERDAHSFDIDGGTLCVRREEGRLVVAMHE
ncbi:DUF7385 family protein [Halopelagius longus]|uniref:Flagella cluster protein n=1 Tax=Halopelagius longus TaxID=1236180 RepID=A0A1H0ZAA0_9EURY|nr:flagella cluster protein [Halopelagius longus]RDI72908.1 flagella cluster protein [Halopelagius longus]SDQ24357.1 hypothetical protein SAMN05216278_1107 [Halopelagius longus]